MKIGDIVQKIFFYDGSARSGTSMSQKLEIVKIEDYNPIDGPRRKNTLIYLSDGTWEYPWNLIISMDEKAEEECVYCGRKFKSAEDGPGVNYCSSECWNYDNYDDNMRREAE